LDSSRLIDAGAGLYLHPEEVDLAALLHEVCQLQREIAPGSQIEERFATPVRMTGDPKLLFQMFSNLLSNAIKYSAIGIPVEVGAGIDSGQAVVSVEDHGIGIPAKDIDSLFERYYRGSNVSGTVGTGMGLYLVKMVAEAHSGGITIESSEGKGSKFSVRLPLKPVATRDAPELSALPSSVEDGLGLVKHKAE